MMMFLCRMAVLANLAIFLSLAPTKPVLAGGTGEWVEGPHTRARLIAASWSGVGDADIAIQIQLEDGWKTYWRNPGDAGVPPRFDWGQSTNLKTATASWPIPKRLPDPYGVSIGYKGSITIPVKLKTSNAGQVVRIKLDMEYGVCAEVCIPVSSTLALELSPNPEDETHNNLIAAWKAKVPSKDPASSGLKLTAIEPLKDGKMGMLVTMTGTGGLKAPDMLVEGPAEYYFSIPELVSKTTDQATFKFEIDGAKTLDHLKGKSMILTIIDKSRALEMNWPLDKFLKPDPS